MRLGAQHQGLVRVLRLGLQAPVVHGLRDEPAHVGAHAPRGGQEDAAVGRHGREPVQQVLQRRLARAPGVRALDRLAQLHLVAQQHDVLRARADGGEVGHGHLAGLVHEQVVELLVGAGVGEQPRGAAHQLPVRVQRGWSLVDVHDQLAVEVAARVPRGRLLAGPHRLHVRSRSAPPRRPRAGC